MPSDLAGDDEAWWVAAISDALVAYRSGTATLRPHDDVMERLESKIRARLDDGDEPA